MESERILEAIKASGVTRIAFVDDAFDAPEIPEEDWGELLQYLKASDAEQVRTAAGIEVEDWQAGIDGLQNSDREPVDELIQKLYAVYVRDFDVRFDPRGCFAALKGSNLQYVRPLLTLVRKANPGVTIHTYGSQMDEGDVQDGPHVVFVDLFLNSGVSPDLAPDPSDAQEAVQKSLERIKPLLKLSPSVILMSSHPDASEVDSYRQNMEEQSRVYASRFGFVNKKLVAEDAGELTVDPKVSDVLLDLFQTYKFGRGLHETLGAWVKAANAAVQSLKGEIDDLELTDLAYLVRFRLAEEGQSLPDYLEWLLGECLLDQVGRKFDEVLPNTHIDKEVRVIDGAFDGPTRKVAELYHRVRIEDKRSRPREHFRLGDLYLRRPNEGPSHLVAIMNPDCDLVKRPGEEKPAAHSVLTLQGKLENFTAPSISVGDFIVVGDQPRNIKWDFRRVETRPFDGVMAQPGQSDAEFNYLGALRPMYAQEIQTKLLNQLGRVGVPVPPVLAFSSSVTLHYAAKGGRSQVIEFPNEGTPCYFVPARQSGQEGVMVFRRQFVRNLIEELNKIDRDTLSATAAGQLKDLLGDSGREKLRKLTADGIELEKDIGYGLLLTKKKAKMGDRSACWGCLVVGMKPEASPDTVPQEEAVIASGDPVAGALAEAVVATLHPASAAVQVVVVEAAQDGSEKAS
jgi:hypothetical protein